MASRKSTRYWTGPVAVRRSLLGAVIVGLLLIPVLSVLGGLAPAEEPAVTIPPPAQDAAPADATTQTMVLAGGCFWGVQAVYRVHQGRHQRGRGLFRRHQGNRALRDGRHRAHRPRRVGAGDFRSEANFLGKILQIYFSVAHNPTELNYQGPDSGPSYRSAIFYANDEQKRIAEAYIAQLDQAHVFKAPIVTKLEAFKGFYPAEDYHQDFLVTHPTYPYIVINDQPKVGNLKRLFADQYRDTPVTVMAANRPTQ